VDLRWNNYACGMPLIAGTEFESGRTAGVVVNTKRVLDNAVSAAGKEALLARNSAGTPVSRNKLEDPLAYLPYCRVSEYRKGKTIYGFNQPTTKIYLVIDGAVKVCRITETGRNVLMDIYKADEFFGESAFLASAGRGAEMAAAVENTKVMAWTVEQVEDIILSRYPQLAIGFVQLFTHA
jgi:CRP-like cAMP-binding protein